MNKKLVYQSSQAMWHQLIMEAETTQAITLNDELKSYLILLLIEYTKKPEQIMQNTAKNYLTSIANRARCREKLRESGDICLLVSGLFPNRYERSALSATHFISIGRSAYATLATHLESNNHLTLSHFYTTLCQDFISLVDLLLTIRDTADGQYALSPLSAHKLFTEANSQYAKKVLQHHRRTLSHVIIQTHNSSSPFKH
jgi:hypothetical protein